MRGSKYVRLRAIARFSGLAFVVAALVVQPILMLNLPAVFAASQPSDVWVAAAMPYPAAGETEYVTLTNQSSMAVDIDGWVLNDGVDHGVSAGGTIASGASVTLCPLSVASSYAYCTTGFSVSALGLNNTGDTITLMSGSTVIDQVSYSSAIQGQEITFSSHVSAPAPLTAPVLVAPTSGSTYTEGDSVHFVWNTVTGADTYRWQYSTDNFVTSTTVDGAGTTHDLLNIAQGTYKWRVAALKTAGSVVGPWSQVWTYTVNAAPVVDSTKPTITLDSPVAGSYNPTTYTVTAHDETALALVTANLYDASGLLKSCSVNPLGVQDYTLVCAVPGGLADGTYSIRYNAKDTSSNLSTTHTASFMVDHNIPTISIKPSSIGSFTNNVFRIADFKLHDNIAVVKYTVNGHDYSVTPNAWSDANGVKVGARSGVYGMNTITVTDQAGNISSPYVFYLDDKGPDVTVKPESVGSNGIYSTVSFKLHDEYKVDKVILNGVTKDLTDNKWSDLNGVTPGVFGAVEGVNTLEVYDVAGNVTTYVFTLDTTRPTVDLLSPASGAINPTGYSIRGQDDTSLYIVTANLYKGSTLVKSCSERDLAVTDYTLNCTLPAVLSDGTYTIRYNAKDMAGNMSFTSSSNFVVDHTKPSVAIDTPASGAVLGTGSFTVSGTASDALTGIDHVAYTVNEIDGIGGSYVASIAAGAATGTTAWSFDVSGLADGYYRIKVQAFDGAGNWKYLYHDVIVDTTRPVTVVHTASNQTFATGPVVVDATTTDAGSGIVGAVMNLYGPSGFMKSYVNDILSPVLASYDYRCSLDITSLADGAYYLKVNSIDLAGHVSNTVRWDFTIDTVGPTLTIAAPSGTLYVGTTITLEGTVDPTVNGPVEVTFAGITKTVTPDASGNWTATFTGVSAGTYTASASAQDGVGNVGVATRTPIVVSLAVVTPATTGTTGGGTTTTTAAATGITGGGTTTTAAATTTTQQDGEVLADETTNSSSDVMASETAADTTTDEDTDCWRILGICWYWWLLIIAIIIAIIYWIRRRMADDEDDQSK